MCRYSELYEIKLRVILKLVKTHCGNVDVSNYAHKEKERNVYQVRNIIVYNMCCLVVRRRSVQSNEENVLKLSVRPRVSVIQV